MASKKYYMSMPDVSTVDSLHEKDFENVDFREGDTFRYRLFYKCEFIDCNFEGVYFDKCVFEYCRFVNCNLKNTTWDNTFIKDSRFKTSTLLGSRFSFPMIHGTLFIDCSLRHAEYDHFVFYRSDFIGCVLCDARFLNGIFQHSEIIAFKSIFYLIKNNKMVIAPYKGVYFSNVMFNCMEFKFLNFDKIELSNFEFYLPNFIECKNVPYVPMTCPEEGSFIAYKKVLAWDEYEGNHKTMIAVLEIPADATRSSGGGTRKCRCNKAKVLRFEDYSGNVLDNMTKGLSFHDMNFVYRVGEYVTEPKFDENRWETCSTGIHFFMNRQEAINYMM